MQAIKQDLPDFHQIGQSIGTSKDYHKMNVVKLTFYMHVNLLALSMTTSTNACGFIAIKSRRQENRGVSTLKENGKTYNEPTDKSNILNR